VDEECLLDPINDVELHTDDWWNISQCPLSFGFSRSPEAILAHLSLARHDHKDVSAVMVDLYQDESLRGLAGPFSAGYDSAINQIAKAFDGTPDITPGELFARLHAIQREDEEVWHRMDVQNGLCRETILWGHAYALGFQVALWILDEDVVHPEGTDYQ
jgi:hypothetical protein